jgi:hypothetical protein
MQKQGQKFSHLALTGGEPLLHQSDMLEFFHYIRENSPRTHTRLYTSGDFLTRDNLSQLKETGLREIRFSIKMEDPEQLKQEVYERIALAKEYIPDVMVEMPVLPGSLSEMKEVLLELDRIGISGINLLEFCFPYNNAQQFIQRGYKVKNPPFQVLYDYWYAGGLPIAGSEENCLLLLNFALAQKLRLGVHYCSLENKFSSQIYQQNAPFRHTYPCCILSEKDYFLKSAKVFGRDMAPVESFLRKSGLPDYRLDKDNDYLEFSIAYLTELVKPFPDLEVGICYHVVETMDGENLLRELRVDYTTPLLLDLQRDI